MARKNLYGKDICKVRLVKHTELFKQISLFCLSYIPFHALSATILWNQEGRRQSLTVCNTAVVLLYEKRKKDTFVHKNIKHV